MTNLISISFRLAAASVLATTASCRFWHSWYGSQREWEQIVKEKPSPESTATSIPLQDGAAIRIWRDDRLPGEFLGRYSWACGRLGPSRLFENLEKIAEKVCKPAKRFEITSEPTDCSTIFRGKCLPAGSEQETVKSV